MATFVEIGGSVVVPSIDNILNMEVGDGKYQALLAENSAEVVDAINRYLAMFNEKIGNVLLSLNNYRESLGVGLVSVEMQILNKRGEEMLLEDERKAPTIGFAEPVSEIDENVKVGFPVGAGVVEEISPLSENLVFGNEESEAQVENGSDRYSVGRGGIPLRVPADEYVVAELAVVDQGKLKESGLPFQERSGEKISGQVYFCRYLTAEAARIASGKQPIGSELE